MDVHLLQEIILEPKKHIMSLVRRRNCNDVTTRVADVDLRTDDRVMTTALELASRVHTSKSTVMYS